MSNLLKNNKGITTLDFMFSMVMVMGFSAILFTLSMTLSVVEITQYIVFSSSRTYYAGHVNEQAQREQAEAKFKQLVSHPVLAPLYSGGWFMLSPTPDQIGDHLNGAGTTLMGPFQRGTITNRYIGVSTNLRVPILDFTVPMLGSTSPSGDGNGKDFETAVGSFLGREPSFDECMGFVQQRWIKLRAMTNYGAQYGRAGATNDFPIADNGC